MLEVSSTRLHDLEQASAAFRQVAEVLAELRGQLIAVGFSPESAESISETTLVWGLDA